MTTERGCCLTDQQNVSQFCSHSFTDRPTFKTTERNHRHWTITTGPVLVAFIATRDTRVRRTRETTAEVARRGAARALRLGVCVLRAAVQLDASLEAVDGLLRRLRCHMALQGAQIGHGLVQQRLIGGGIA